MCFTFPDRGRKRSFVHYSARRVGVGLVPKTTGIGANFICQPGRFRVQAKLQFEVYQGNAATLEKKNSERYRLICNASCCNWSTCSGAANSSNKKHRASTKDLQLIISKTHQRPFPERCPVAPRLLTEITRRNVLTTTSKGKFATSYPHFRGRHR